MESQRIIISHSVNSQTMKNNTLRTKKNSLKKTYILNRTFLKPLKR